jgi:hypothetical protein
VFTHTNTYLSTVLGKGVAGLLIFRSMHDDGLGTCMFQCARVCGVAVMDRFGIRTCTELMSAGGWTWTPRQHALITWRTGVGRRRAAREGKQIDRAIPKRRTLRTPHIGFVLDRQRTLHVKTLRSSHEISRTSPILF